MIKTAEKGVVVQQGHVDFVDEFEKSFNQPWNANIFLCGIVITLRSC